MKPHGHAQAEARHLHLHRVALEKLRRQPDLTQRALALVERWIASDEHAPSRPWLEEWRLMLSSWPIDRIAGLVLDPERGQTLRQCSPLAPVLTPQERWAALKELSSARGSADGSERL